MEEIQTRIFEQNGSIYTENMVPSEKVYGERLVSQDGVEYRHWKPERSKAGAAVKKGIELELEEDSFVLYLGAASGTTVSHFSDICRDGIIVGVEYSDTVIRKLVDLAEKRENIAPILGNARKPEEYTEFVNEADIVFQDISQKDQVSMFTKNCEKFLKQDGTGLLALKAQSISSTRDPKEIYDEAEEDLKEKFEIVEKTTLEPFETDHMFFKLKLK